MQSCRARQQVRIRTLAALQATDWTNTPVVVCDDPTLETAHQRQTELVHRILRQAVSHGEQWILLLEDDLIFNALIRHNLRLWYPLRMSSPDQHFFASLYHPASVPLSWQSPERNYGRADVSTVWGSQAVLLSRKTARYILTCWGVQQGPHIDLKLARLAARVCPLIYHIPSLVQHVGYESVWGGPFSSSSDFDREWKAGESEELADLRK